MAKSRLEKYFSAESASWMAFSVFAPVSVLGVPLTIANDSSKPDAFLQWVGIGFIATIVASLPLLMFQIFIRRHESKISLHVPAFIAVVATGALRGLVIAGLSEPSGLHDEVLPLVRVLNSMLTTTIWLSIAGLTIASRRRYVFDYQNLFAKAVSARAVQIADADSIEALSVLEKTSRELLSVGSKLRSTFEAVSPMNAPEGKLDRDALRAIARYVHEAVEKEIRPLSHRLWFKDPYLPPRVRIATLISDAAMKLPFPIRQVSWLVLPGLFIGFPVRLGLRNGLILAVVSSAAVYAILAIANRLATRALARVAALAALFMLTFLPASIAVSLQELVPTLHVKELYIFLSMFGLVALIVMLQMVIMARSDRELVLHELSQMSQRVSEDASADAASGERARIASFLHNTVQSELTSVALQLENAADSHDLDSARSTLVRAEQILNRSFVDDFNAFYASPLERVSALPLAWQGIAEIKIGVEDFAHLPREVQVAASQLIEEGIANAVRSGGATSVDVDISIRDAQIRICVADNGTLQVGSEPGMGTSWLNSVAGSHWSRTSDNGLTTLEVYISVTQIAEDNTPELFS